MTTNKTSVEVDIILPQDYSQSGEASVRVVVEDVSELDAAARIIAEKHLETNVAPGKHIVTTVDVPLNEIDPRRSYNVRAHVSRNQTGAIEPGDLITTQSVPLRIDQQETRLSVPLREVR
jgi:uncharacterized lipoprotein YbaY